MIANLWHSWFEELGWILGMLFSVGCTGVGKMLSHKSRIAVIGHIKRGFIFFLRGNKTSQSEEITCLCLKIARYGLLLDHYNAV